jgi:hypothetical protein
VEEAERQEWRHTGMKAAIVPLAKPVTEAKSRVSVGGPLEDVGIRDMKNWVVKYKISLPQAPSVFLLLPDG